MKSIRFKLWAGMMLLVMMVLILLWLFQIVFLESFYTHIQLSTIQNEGLSIAKLYEKNDTSLFLEKIDAFAFKNNLSIEVLDADGNTLHTSGGTGNNGQIPMMRNAARTQAYQSILKGQEVRIPMTHPRFGNKFMLMGFPIKASFPLSGGMLIQLPLAPIEDTSSILKRQLLWITGLLMLAAVAVSFLLSRGLTKPILEIKKAAEGMASGDYSIRIARPQGDEIGALAQTINHLGHELAKIEALRKELIANVSHELRTPLSLIRGYAETIRDVSGNIPEKREKHLEMMIEESERLSGMVDDMLNLSQLQAGYVSFNKTQVSLKELVENIVKRFDIMRQMAEIQITQTYMGQTIVEADEASIAQVLYNLIQNALNHTPKGGKIQVSAKEEKDYVRIEVSDTGAGIAADVLPRIWDRYYKAEKTAGKRYLGTGLGLAIVKALLEAHNAVFGVESKADEGSTFWFELKK